VKVLDAKRNAGDPIFFQRITGGEIITAPSFSVEKLSGGQKNSKC